jgi:hypothetical protein
MRINTLRINNKNKHYILPDSKKQVLCTTRMGSYFKLVLNFTVVRMSELHFNLGYNNKAKKRHFEERHYRASGGIGKEIALHFAEKDGMLLLL